MSKPQKPRTCVQIEPDLIANFKKWTGQQPFTLRN